MVLDVSLGFIAPGLFESVTFGKPSWDSATQRPSYSVNMLETMPNTHNLTGKKYTHVKLTPIEAQDSAGNCGKSSYVTWVLYYTASENDVVTCENYANLKLQNLSNMFFLDEAVDMMDTINYCPMKIAGEYFTGKSIAAGDDFQFTCNLVPTTTTTTTTTEETTTTTTTEETTTTTTEKPTTTTEKTTTTTEEATTKPDLITDPCDVLPCTDPLTTCVVDNAVSKGFICECIRYISPFS